ncbi:MAG TPA: ABC transporter ATP-binding protein [Candidatus Baltobacteraceae bacterium]|nr:ABC transporter ATP-binding protein [Candidatus Baltobacteraceae bacterium]
MADSPVLRVEGITKRFGGLTALEGVRFSVEAGEVVGLIGPNGAGKTTLFNVISGIEPPSAGRVVFRGEPISGLAPHLIARRGLARTFQIVRPFPGLTVLENLAVGGLTDRVFDFRGELAEARLRARAVAHEVGLHGWLEREASTLPHGSLKRLEIGRAMLMRPTLLLLDEPFAGLGGHEIEEVSDVIAGLAARGITLIIIEHKLRALMRLVGRAVVLNFGKLIAEGAPREVAASPIVREAYLGEKGAARLA